MSRQLFHVLVQSCLNQTIGRKEKLEDLTGTKGPFIVRSCNS